MVDLNNIGNVGGVDYELIFNEVVLGLLEDVSEIMEFILDF